MKYGTEMACGFGALAALVACSRSERNVGRQTGPLASATSVAATQPVHATPAMPHQELSPPEGMVRIVSGAVGDCWSREYGTEGDCTRRVMVDAFHLDAAEVTVGAYGQCVQAGACTAPVLKAVDQRWLCTWVNRQDRGNVPMNCVAFEEAQAYRTWKGKRLPQLHEWLHALRLNHPHPYLWDGEPPSTEQVFALGPCWGQSPPCAVPHWPVSSASVSDLVGNVAEWVNASGATWVAGLSWEDPDPHDMALLRVDRARRATSSARGFRIGFRCARATGQDH
jgi:formylglycine-generating enzyme required for sulfatase activity